MILAINELQIKYLIILDYFKRSFYLQFLLLCISLFIYLMKISSFHFFNGSNNGAHPYHSSVNHSKYEKVILFSLLP